MKIHHSSPALLAGILTLLAVGISKPGLAQPPSPPRNAEGTQGPGRPAAPPRVSPLMAALDTDKDGALSPEEILKASAALKTLDKDGNGQLTLWELHPPIKPVVIPPADIVERLMEFDRNGDGKLTRDELPERLRSAFDTIDGDKDGILTQSELTAFVEKSEAEQRKEEEKRLEAARRTPEPTAPPTPRLAQGGGGRPLSPLMAALDTDKDGTISAAEIAAASAALKTLDKDGDGKISAEELRPAPVGEPSAPPRDGVRP